jgi:hypothetical protein
VRGKLRSIWGAVSVMSSSLCDGGGKGGDDRPFLGSEAE